MKIIEYGHIKSIEHFCTGCGCTFEYTPHDTKKKYIGGRKCSYSVKCPVCGRNFVIRIEEVNFDN